MRRVLFYLLSVLPRVAAFQTGTRLSARAFGASTHVARRPPRRTTIAMPSVVVQAAVAPKSGAAGFCKLLSSTVAGTLGKPESYVLTTFTKVDAVCYGGDAETPAAFLYLSSLGAITPETNAATSAALAEVLEAELGVPKGRYYINFFDSERSNMGYNGGTF